MLPSQQGEEIGNKSQPGTTKRGSCSRRSNVQKGRAGQGRRQGDDGISGQRPGSSGKNCAFKGASVGQGSRRQRAGTRRQAGTAPALGRRQLTLQCNFVAAPCIEHIAVLYKGSDLGRSAREPRVRTPLNGFWLALFVAHRQPRSRGGVPIHPQGDGRALGAATTSAHAKRKLLH
jgi:hypothetical protein